ncbi:MAG: CCE_0567 family metalloprotein [Aeromonadaceae bacterium]
MSEQHTPKQELAKLRRQATELAGAIHDVVEESLWQEYGRLPELSAQLVKAVEKAEAFRQEQGL